MDGDVLLFWVHSWCIFFSKNVIRSDVEPTGSWRLDFWNVSFGTSVRQSDVEPLGSWQFNFGTLGSLLMPGLVSTSIWVIHPRGGTKLRLWLYLCKYSCLMAVWWLGGWCLVKNPLCWFVLGPSKRRSVLGVFDPCPNLISCPLLWILIFDSGVDDA